MKPDSTFSKDIECPKAFCIISKWKTTLETSDITLFAFVSLNISQMIYKVCFFVYKFRW